MAFTTNPKPQPRKRVKARRDRRERSVKKSVREETVERDGYCLIATRLPRAIAVLLGPCGGASQWAHIGRHRRCFTRGMEPEQRHTTAGTGQMCEHHHRAYDAHKFDFGNADMNDTISIIRRAA